MTLQHLTITLIKHIFKKILCVLLSTAYLQEQPNFVKTKQGFVCHRRLTLKLILFHGSVCTLFHQQIIEKFHQPICSGFVSPRELDFKGKKEIMKVSNITDYTEPGLLPLCF